MEEVMMIKTKKGWKAYDRLGNSIEAPTKDMARIMYYTHFVQPCKVNNLFNASSFEEVKYDHL